MMVQAQEEMGEGLANPTNPHHTPIITQPSTSKPQKKQKPRKPKRKDTKIPRSSSPTESIADEAANEEHVPTHSNDPLLSGDDSIKLNELMELCTILQSRVLALETTKTIQVSVATTTTTAITEVDLTLAQALAELRSAKPKVVAEKFEKANISWDNVQAMIEADKLLDERLQAREQEELTDKEKARLFVELLEKRKKHFAALRAHAKRNKPPTKA
ncbi:hypothetical protein Tco_1046578 [Tanacetum coccineum]